MPHPSDSFHFPSVSSTPARPSGIPRKQASSLTTASGTRPTKSFPRSSTLLFPNGLGSTSSKSRELAAPVVTQTTLTASTSSAASSSSASSTAPSTSSSLSQSYRAGVADPAHPRQPLAPTLSSSSNASSASTCSGSTSGSSTSMTGRPMTAPTSVGRPRKTSLSFRKAKSKEQLRSSTTNGDPEEAMIIDRVDDDLPTRLSMMRTGDTSEILSDWGESSSRRSDIEPSYYDVKIPLGQSRSLRTGFLLDEGSSPDQIRKRSKADTTADTSFSVGTPFRSSLGMGSPAFKLFSPGSPSTQSVEESPPPDTPIHKQLLKNRVTRANLPPLDPLRFSNTSSSLFAASKPIRTDEDPFGKPLMRSSSPHLASLANATAHKSRKSAEIRRPSLPHNDLHRRTISTESKLSRSKGRQSGLDAQISLQQNHSNRTHPTSSSISSASSSLLPKSISTSSQSSFGSLTPEEEAAILQDVIPLQAAFEDDAHVAKKFKSPPTLWSKDATTLPSIRPGILQRASSSFNDGADCQMTGEEDLQDWPAAFIPGHVQGQRSFGQIHDIKPIMPDTPVKRPSVSGRMSQSISHPALPHSRLLAESSPPSASPTDSMQASPTVRVAAEHADSQGLTASGSRDRTLSLPHGLLRRLSAGSSEPSDQEGTPTKSRTPARVVAQPLPSPIIPRHSLALPSTTSKTRLAQPRPSAPVPSIHDQEEPDIFDTRFTVLETLGKGAFSEVFKVKERESGEIFAVKRAKGVFEGVKDRLRHLEEVDILRHLSRPSHPNVISFMGAWEQSRQLFIQTELCLGTLAFFLEEYGSVIERLDEARSWKIARELADGLQHIHSHSVIHFDIKPANVLINKAGALKIGDFGLASRWPRVDAATIISGSGMGGVDGTPDGIRPLSDREGDRIYMAPEMLRGKYGMAVDVFSFGLVVLEAATNICVPDGGIAWHALRSDDFSVVDFSTLSPALADLIMACMKSEPEERPQIAEVIRHPVISRARETGREALKPESSGWLAQILSVPSRLPKTTTMLNLKCYEDVDMS